MFAGQENWPKWYRWGKKTTANLFMFLNICFFQIKLQELRGFLFASQNVLTGVIKCINSPCKTWLPHFICAQLLLKRDKKNYLTALNIFEGSFCSVVVAMLLDWPHWSLKRRWPWQPFLVISEAQAYRQILAVPFGLRGRRVKSSSSW